MRTHGDLPHGLIPVGLSFLYLPHCANPPQSLFPDSCSRPRPYFFLRIGLHESGGDRNPLTQAVGSCRLSAAEKQTDSLSGSLQVWFPAGRGTKNTSSPSVIRTATYSPMHCFRRKGGLHRDNHRVGTKMPKAVKREVAKTYSCKSANLNSAASREVRT